MRATSIQLVIDNNKLTPMGPDANITNKSLLRSADIILLFFSLLNLHKKHEPCKLEANLQTNCAHFYLTSPPSPLHLEAQSNNYHIILYYNEVIPR